MNKLTYCIVAMGAAVVIGNGGFWAGDEVCLRLEMWPSSARLSLGKEINAKSCIWNACESPVWIPRLLEVGSNLDVVIIAPGGNSVRYIVENRDYKQFTRDMFLELPPNHCWGRIVKISARPFETRGKYVLQVVYENQDSGRAAGLDAWMGVLKSNTAEVIVD